MSQRRLGRGLVAWTLVRGVVFVVGAVVGLEGHVLLGGVLLFAAIATTYIPGPLARSRDHWIDGWNNETD